MTLRRRVPLDWDELEVALTWRDPGWRYYLDVETGRTVWTAEDPGGLAGGAAEDLDHAELPAEGGPISDRMAEIAFGEGRLIRVDPLPSSVEYRWMEAFAATVTDAVLRGRLDASLGGRGAFRRFKDALLDHPEERARWFAFRAGRMWDEIRDWLEARDLEATTEPPGRGGERRCFPLPSSRARP